MAEGVTDVCVTFPEDIRHKMCKKIAQLTKVIYQLNSRSEDHDHELNGVQAAYETEIEQILKDAYSKINAFKKQLADFKSTDRSEKLVKLEREKHVAEKHQWESRYREQCARVQAQCEDIRRQSRQKTARMKEELSRAKEDFRKKFSVFQQTTDKLEGRNRTALEELKETHQNEVEKLVQSSNAKYNAMLAEMLDQQESLTRQLEKESSVKAKEKYERKMCHMKEIAHARLTEEMQNRKRLEAQFKQTEAKLGKEMGNILRDLQTLRESETNLNAIISALKETVSQKEVEIDRMNSAQSRRRDENERSISEFETELSAKNDEINSLRDQLSSTNTQLDTKSCQLSQLHVDHQALSDQISAKSASVQDLEKKMQLARADNQHTIDEKMLEIRKLKTSVEKLTTHLRSKQNDHKTYLESAEKLDKSRNVEIAKLETQLKSLKSNSARSATKLSSELSNANVEIQKLKSKIEDKKVQFSSERQREEVRHKSELDELHRTECELRKNIAEIQSESKVFQDRIVVLQSEAIDFKKAHVDSLTTLNKEKSKELKELKIKLQSSLDLTCSSLNGKIEELTKKLQKRDSDIEVKTRDLERLEMPACCFRL
eukprot:182995_1